MYHLVFHPRARKNLDKIPILYRQKIIQTLEIISQSPFTGKALLGIYKGHYSVRAWPYRIVYMIEREILTVIVVTIDHRKDVYKQK